MKSILFLVLFFSSLSFAQGAYDFVQVSGEGDVKVKPDYVTLSTTVYSRATSAQQAQKDNAREMARIDKILKQDFKIEPKDIQTLSFQVSPQYEYSKDRPIYKGMAVTHTLLVKFRKVDEVGGLLDKLVTGPNQEGFGVRIDDISFGSDQMKTYQLQALDAAVADAKARAQTLSKAAARNLLGVRKISDSKVSAPEFQPMRAMGKATFASMAADAATQVAPGEITVHAQVQVEYEVK